MWFDNEPTVRIVAAFTSDVAQHDAALRPRLRHPGRLVVQRMPHSLADLRQVRHEIERTLQQQEAETGRPILTSVGEEKAVIHVALRADGSLLNASHEAVGGYSGWIAGTGLTIDLESGRSASIKVIFGTASSREELGYALPPGKYWLKVQVPFRHGHGEPTHALTAPLTQITIVP